MGQAASGDFRVSMLFRVFALMRLGIMTALMYLDSVWTSRHRSIAELFSVLMVECHDKLPIRTFRIDFRVIGIIFGTTTRITSTGNESARH